MSNNIAGKVIVITGASSGLGEAAARLLAEQGATLVLAARRADRIQQLARSASPKKWISMKYCSGLLVRNFSSSIVQKISNSVDMEIKRSGSQPSGKGPADWFTGTVRIDPLFQASAPARVAGASVTFEPGARTNWHTHPLGQTLIVTAGCGWAQREGGPLEEIRPGDVVWFAPGERHWHGATATTAMTHIAIQESLDGKVVEWLEPVREEEYGNN